MGDAERRQGTGEEEKRREEGRKREKLIAEQEKTAEVEVTHIKQKHTIYIYLVYIYEHIPTNPEFPRFSVVHGCFRRSTAVSTKISYIP